MGWAVCARKTHEEGQASSSFCDAVQKPVRKSREEEQRHELQSAASVNTSVVCAELERAHQRWPYLTSVCIAAFQKNISDGGSRAHMV